MLLASGKTVPISSLKKGDKVKAVDTKTGKPQAKDVTAVLVHYDTDLYDLTVKSGGHTEVIHTTSSHLFWDPVTDKWVKASALRKGEHLRTPDGTSATAVGGSVPADHDGWMWDLTVQQDHDFYVLPAGDGTDGYYHVDVDGVTPVLVHNCNEEAQTDLARMRRDMGMSTPQQEDIDVANKVPGASRNTLGRMDFDGDREAIYGQNGRLPRPYEFPGKGFGVAAKSFEDDAEGDMVSQAMSKGYSGGNATIYTDRATCSWCQNSMAGYARLLNLDTLTVYGPDGLIDAWNQNGRVR